jgi:hypothetical protein
MDIMARPDRHVDGSPGVDSSHAAQSGACARSVGHEGRDLTLTLSCKDCTIKARKDGAGLQSPLSDPRCLQNILEALAVEPDVDTLILAGHIETQLRTEGMQALERIAVLASDLAQLSLREPPAGSRDCQRCGIHPQRLFGDLQNALLADMPSFPDALKGGIARIQAAAAAPFDNACARCATDTSGDIAFAAESFEGLARFIMKQGYQIVV